LDEEGKMSRFSVQSTAVLGALSFLALVGLLAVENAKTTVRKDWYHERIEATRLARSAAQTLQRHRLASGLIIDTVNDPNRTALIGQEYTLITTDHGSIEAKLAATDPRFAAVVVELLRRAGVSEHDCVAVAFTGSFPGLNIAVLAAAETLNLHPLIITSVGASNWGANDPDFTWLDMESHLYETYVFSHRSIAASLGGGMDKGRGLSPEGRRLIEEAIARNDVPIIKEQHLEHSISRRMEIYEKRSKGRPIRAFINVGGGIASLGSAVGGSMIPAGLTIHLMANNYPVHGVLMRMAQARLPIIHLLNVQSLARRFGLAGEFGPITEPGAGDIFVERRYDLRLVWLVFLLLVGVILWVSREDRRRHRLGAEILPTGRPFRQADGRLEESEAGVSVTEDKGI
jgi:poly-gamma-glutamate system protein